MKFLGLFVISALLAVCNAAPSVLEARCTESGGTCLSDGGCCSGDCVFPGAAGPARCA